MGKLDIFNEPSFNNAIVKEEYHTYYPITNNFGNNDEIKFVIQNQDIYTTPSDSYLYVEGVVNSTADGFKFTNNPLAFLLDEVRYALNGVEIDRVRDVGITSTLKGLVSFDTNRSNRLSVAGWGPLKIEQSIYSLPKKQFYCCMPLNMLLGFAEDYKQIIVNARQELTLLRSRTDLNSYKIDKGEPSDTVITLTKFEWKVPHVLVNDEVRLSFLQQLNMDRPLTLAFRRWELHELPALKNNVRDIWSIKSSPNLERPRYVIVAFQRNRKNNVLVNSSLFDHLNIRNIKVHLNSDQIPYDNLNLNIENGNYVMLYNMFANFPKSYYGSDVGYPELDYTQFLKHMMFVFDCSKQNEVVKLSTVDLKIEVEAHTNLNQDASAYCLILYESVVTYTPLSNIVKRLQ
jgi:hypothetical protein